jgi:hypothetical protein
MLLELAHEEGSFAGLRMTVKSDSNSNAKGGGNIKCGCNLNLGCYGRRR